MGCFVCVVGGYSCTVVYQCVCSVCVHVYVCVCVHVNFYVVRCLHACCVCEYMCPWLIHVHALCIVILAMYMYDDDTR